MSIVHIVLLAGWAGLTTGTFAAAAADAFPAHRSALQHWGGSLLVGSIALIGLTYPFVE
jgi:hypothetical protein